ncbi:CDP-alcohol phosphatidyltransferase [Thraustotheca clavata]|uniref:CDP-alcohol phosphatidyltransferase n=1 Tax=Thraustotheca clavata TaxID=74557 RepID=A0A1V9ZFD8_9STRA|nr:CDP-alcohol phosphatidyltransferase [Thraustotheca clavata]
MGILSKQALEGIAAYKYKAGQYTWLDLQLNHYWNFMVELLPMWMAPNLVTLSGTVIMTITTGTLLAICPLFVGPAPAWAYAICGLGLFVYQTLDAIDGKQARRTGSSSPLGQLFDHGCDALSALVNMLSAVVALQLGPSHFSYATICSVSVSFYLAQWEEYHTGTMSCGNGYFGVTEGQLVLVFVHVWTAVFGSSFWHLQIAPFFPYAFAEVLVVCLILSNVILAYTKYQKTTILYPQRVYSISNVFLAPLDHLKGEELGNKQVSKHVALLQLVPPFAVTFGGFLLISGPLAPYYAQYPLLFLIPIGLSFVMFSSRMIVSHMCKVPFTPQFRILMPLVVLLLATYSKIEAFATIPPLVSLTAYCILVTFIYFHYMLSVVFEICAHLKIPLLTLPKKLSTMYTTLFSFTVNMFQHEYSDDRPMRPSIDPVRRSEFDFDKSEQPSVFTGVAKVLVMLVNLAFMMLGGMLIYFTLWVKHIGATKMFENNYVWVQDTTFTVLLVFGALVLVVALVGCLGAWARNRHMLLIYAAGLVLNLVLFSTIAVGGFFSLSTANAWADSPNTLQTKEIAVAKEFNEMYCKGTIAYYCSTGSVSSSLQLFLQNASLVTLAKPIFSQLQGWNQMCNSTQVRITNVPLATKVNETCALCSQFSYDDYADFLTWSLNNCPLNDVSTSYCSIYMRNAANVSTEYFKGAPYGECRVKFLKLWKSVSNFLAIGGVIVAIISLGILIASIVLRSRLPFDVHCLISFLMVTFAVSSVALGDYACLVENDIVRNLKEFNQEGCSTILQSSPTDGHFGRTDNGFVNGVVDAYNQHLNLIIRPDDVWLAIMTQFGLYVNGNAEVLRSKFVQHEGKKELEVVTGGTLHTVDFGALAIQMVDQMNANLNDPTLGEWILPGFSTTTVHDTIVGSIVMMASMKKYFSYKMSLRCGIPEVALLGTVQDWENIRSRVDTLRAYGEKMIKWVDMLSGVLDQFVMAAKGTEDTEFWQRICHHIGGGSGPRYISGWISVFCVFNEDGQWQGNRKRVKSQGEETVSDFPIVNTNNIPPGYLTVDVKIDDNGVEHKGFMFAGHLTYEVKQRNTIAPYLSWAIALKDGT